ncbi:MAG: transporter substrate-binding domain-containing protein [Oscillospiraceae bacterium]|nr:transporter substrate-binding domain-containing protein [Oscillospiraceae bacterium]
MNKMIEANTKSVAKGFIFLVLMIIAVVLLTGCFGNDDEEVDLEALIEANAPEFASVEEMRELRIGGVNAPIVHTIKGLEFPDADTTEFNQNVDMIAALQARQIDGFMVSKPTAFFIARSNPDLAVLDDVLWPSQAGVGVRAGNVALLTPINELIRELREDGTLDAMVAFWYNDDVRNTELPDLTLPTTGTPIRIGVAENLEPSSFLDANGELTGLDIELIHRIAIHLNRPVEFVPLLMAGYAAAVQAGQVDMVIGNWIINPELTGIDFSEPYFDTPFMMVVRRGN